MKKGLLVVACMVFALTGTAQINKYIAVEISDMPDSNFNWLLNNWKPDTAASKTFPAGQRIDLYLLRVRGCLYIQGSRMVVIDSSCAIKSLINALFNSYATLYPSLDFGLKCKK